MGMVQILQSTPILLRAWVGAGDDQNRRTRHMRVGDPRHRVGDTWPGGDQCHAQLARQFGMRLRHMHSCPLVAHVDNADPMRIKPHPDWHYVAAA